VTPLSAPPPQSTQPGAPQPTAPANAANTAAAVPEQKLAVAEITPAEKAPPKKTAPAASATTAPVTPPASPPARGPANVTVVMTAAYPFEVRDGGRVISALSTSHELPPQQNGKTLRVYAEDVFLDQAVKVDGGDERRFEYSPPGLGRIHLRAYRGDCKAMIGKKDLGPGPWPKPYPVVAGAYQVNLVCPDGQNPVQQTTVTQGLPANVFFRRQ
jgi:hypothetical protein